MYTHEKQRRNERNHRQKKKFREVAAEVGLHDLGFEGPNFTWEKKKEEG